MGNAALTLANIAASYEPSKRVLSGLSLDVTEGEVIALLGSSGCGKSTLLLVIGGFLPPNDGELRFRGQPIAGPDTERILLTQTDSTWPWKTALENVAYPLRCQGLSRRKAKEIALHWLNEVGLADAAHLYPQALSGGMRQRVGIAKVFALKPHLLLLDEPFGSLDEITRHTVNQVFLNLWRQNRMTVLFVTHSLDEALYLSDRVIVMGGDPAHVVGDFRTPLPRPDKLEKIFSPAGDTLRVKILALLSSNSAR